MKNNLIYQINHGISKKIVGKAKQETPEEWYKKSWLKENKKKFGELITKH